MISRYARSGGVVMLFRTLCACVLVGACFSRPAAAQQNLGNVRAFLPPAADVKQHLSLDLDNDRTAEAVLVYTIPDQSRDVYHTTGVQVLKFSPISGWAVAFEETVPKMMQHDYIKIEKLTTPKGKDALLVVANYSGAGTVAGWWVLALINDKITRLDAARRRGRVLNARGYVFNGYNGVESKGDLIIETVSGYSSHTARCCSNRPSLEVRFKFTGNSITLDSVKELPYRVPESGPHGPLLRLSRNGLWAYGYKVADGFLALAGSESAKVHSPSTSPAIVNLRKSLLNEGVLVDAESYLSLMQNHKFTSLSVAASVMLARPANGQIEWKDENGRPAGTGTSRAQ